MIFQRKNVISSTFAFDAALANSLPKLAELDQGGRFKPGNTGANGNGKAPSFESWHNPREAFETRLTLLVIAGDFAVIALGFIAATVLMEGGFTLAPAIPGGYKSILAVSAFILWRLRGRDLYSYRSLLQPSKIWHKLLGSLCFCLLGFAALALMIPTDPPVPWQLIAMAGLIMCSVICLWRVAVSRVVCLPFFSSRLRHRLIVIGGGSQTLRIQKTLGKDSDMEFVGWVLANKPNHNEELEKYRLGSLHELRKILRNHAVSTVALVESESLQREGVAAVARVCEIAHVEFNMVPHFFEILVSGVRPKIIGDMQLLGVHCLPLYGLRNRFVKRTVDIVGALVGLAISIPLMLVFGALVFLESPGPIFYRQVRQGRNGRLFYIIKLRSMRLNAEADGKPKWAQNDDSRRLRIGAFMRKWNIDEIPQFFNVLCGQMSLVGPRPERPELIARFKSKIPHYQARHMYQPGMTGWAQINGWRGNTCLEERIRHDIWYLENWSVWLDFRIMLQTFHHQKNAY